VFVKISFSTSLTLAQGFGVGGSPLAVCGLPFAVGRSLVLRRGAPDQIGYLDWDAIRNSQDLADVNHAVPCKPQTANGKPKNS
jgi:hypothetical protein